MKEAARTLGRMLTATLLAGCMGLVGARALADELVLAERGETIWRIVVHTGTDVSTNAAAYDLAGLLHEMTGATFFVITDVQGRGDEQPEIILGADNTRLDALGLTGMAEGFVLGEYEIRTLNADTPAPSLIIAGGPGRGTLNGIYGLLRDHLGCAWFAPGVSRIPRHDTLRLPAINDRRKPGIGWRGIGNIQTADPLWAARNRLNIAHSSGRATRSHPLCATMWTDNLRASHSLGMIPLSLYDEHPEFYAEIDGKRGRPASQGVQVFDMTNENFAKWVAEWWKDKLDRDPSLRSVDIGHTDHHVKATDRRSLESYERLGVTGTYIQFANRVAEELTRHYPDVIITTLGYGITRKPPPIKAHPNVRPIYAPIYADWGNAFDQGAVNRNYRIMEDLQEWVDKTEQLGFWYYFHQQDYSMPHPKLFAAKRNFQIFRDLGVDGVYVETNHHFACSRGAGVGGTRIPAWETFRHGEFIMPWASNHIKAYIAIQLLWDPDYSVEQGIREYCETCYDPAGAELAQWFIAIETLDSYQQTLGLIGDMYPDGQIYCRVGSCPLMKHTVMQDMSALFDAAEAKVSDDPVLLRRVRFARWSLQLHILTYAPPKSPLRPPAFDAFFAFVDESGISSIERTPIIGANRWFPALRQAFSEPEKIRIEYLDLPGENKLRNSSFEEDADGDGVPDGWTTAGALLPDEFPFDPAATVLDRSGAVSGDVAMKLTKAPGTPATAGIAQRLEVGPGETWLATVRYRGHAREGNIYLRLVALDEEGAYVEHVAGTHGHEDTGPNWFRLRAKMKMPADARRLEVQFAWDKDRHATASEADGIICIDDLECGRMPGD